MFNNSTPPSNTSPKISAGKSPLILKSNFPVKRLTSIETLRTEEICFMLEKIPDYNFPIFDFQIIAHGRPLTIMSHQLVVQSGILSRLGLPLEKFLNFIATIEMSYESTLPCNIN